MWQINWDKVADQQFKDMPEDFKQDWAELRSIVYDHE